MVLNIGLPPFMRQEKWVAWATVLACPCLLGSTTRANQFAHATLVGAHFKLLDPLDIPAKRPRNRIVSRDQRAAHQLLRRLDVVFRFKPAGLPVDLDQPLEAVLIPQKSPPLRRH